MAFSEPGIDKRGLWTERLMLAVPDGHPLVEADAIHWTDLRSEVFVLPTDGIGPVIANVLTSQLGAHGRSEEHTSELQSLMRISYAVFCLKKKNKRNQHTK